MNTNSSSFLRRLVVLAAALALACHAAAEKTAGEKGWGRKIRTAPHQSQRQSDDYLALDSNARWARPLRGGSGLALAEIYDASGSDLLDAEVVD